MIEKIIKLFKIIFNEIIEKIIKLLGKLIIIRENMKIFDKKGGVIYTKNCETMKECLESLINERKNSKNSKNLEKLAIVEQNLENLVISRKINLRGSNFRGSNFNNSKLIKTKMDKTRLSHSLWNNAELTEVSLYKARARNCSFKKAKLTNVYFWESNFEGTDFREANISYGPTNYIIMHSNFQKCDFKNAEIKNVIFNKTSFNGADFGSAKFRDVVFVDCSFKETIFNNADIRNTIFDEKNSFYKTKFFGTDLRKCIFIKTQFKNCDFSSANMQYFWGIKTNIFDSTLHQTKFSKVPKKVIDRFPNILKDESFYDKLDFLSPKSERFDIIRKEIFLREKESVTVEVTQKAAQKVVQKKDGFKISYIKTSSESELEIHEPEPANAIETIEKIEKNTKEILKSGKEVVVAGKELIIAIKEASEIANDVKKNGIVRSFVDFVTGNIGSIGSKIMSIF